MPERPEGRQRASTDAKPSTLTCSSDHLGPLLEFGASVRYPRYDFLADAHAATAAADARRTLVIIMNTHGLNHAPRAFVPDARSSASPSRSSSVAMDSLSRIAAKQPPPAPAPLHDYRRAGVYTLWGLRRAAALGKRIFPYHRECRRDARSSLRADFGAASLRRKILTHKSQHGFPDVERGMLKFLDPSPPITPVIRR